MSTNVQLKLRKKVYNALTDAVNGVVVFDNSTGKIYVGGDCFSSEVSDASLNSNTGVLTITKVDSSTITVNLTSFEQTSNKVTSLSDSSTDAQYPSAKCIYDIITDNEEVVHNTVNKLSDSIGLNENLEYSSNEDLIANEDNLRDAVDVLANNMYDKIIQVVAYANSLIEKGVVTPIPYVPSLVYAPEVITDTTSTAATLNPMKGNAVYIFTQPLTELNIIEISALELETTIYFTTHATTTFSYSFPQGMYKANVIKFDKNTHYCLSIKDGVVVLEKIENYLHDSDFIYSSDQLMGGVLKSRPDVVEISGSTPVIANTQPYTIYKLDEVTSLTMQQIPANTLETIAYFSAGNTPVNLVLSGIVPLKLASGSTTDLINGHFCLVIKDGVVVITEIKEI